MGKTQTQDGENTNTGWGNTNTGWGKHKHRMGKTQTQDGETQMQRGNSHTWTERQLSLVNAHAELPTDKQLAR